MSGNEEIKGLLKAITILAQKDLISPLSGGCVSMRLGDHYLITPEFFNPYEIKEDDLIPVRIASGKSERAGVNKDYLFHSLAYQTREDVNAIIFGTPTYATLLSSTNSLPRTDFFVDAWTVLGTVRKSTYTHRGTDVLAARVMEELHGSSVVLLENYGAITIGKSILEAAYRMELLEKVSKMTAYTSKLTIRPFNARQKLELRGGMD